MSDTPPDTLDASSDNPPRVDNRNDSGETKKPENKSSPVPDSKSDDQGKSDEAKRKARRPTVAVIGIAVVALLLIGGAYYWWTTRNLESTDDAYTDGRAVTIAPRVSGAVVSLDVTDNQFVKKDQPLIHIDPRQYIIDRDQAVAALDTAKAQYAGQQFGLDIAPKNFPPQLEQAQAQRANANANLAKTQADYDRQRSLTKQATSQQDIDAATSALKQAQAQVMLAEGQVEQAQARLDQANLNQSWTLVKAPQDGWITKRNVEVGNYVAPGQQIFSIVAPEVWITANFKESQLADMRKGQPVKIKIDAYPGLDLRGHIDSIQLGSGSKFTAFPPENATGNFVKVVQRVPVKIVIDSGLNPDIPLPLGISAEPTVTVR